MNTNKGFLKKMIISGSSFYLFFLLFFLRERGLSIDLCPDLSELPLLLLWASEVPHFVSQIADFERWHQHYEEKT
jgi:hypothetical protein